jgi:hypothetical protein
MNKHTHTNMTALAALSLLASVSAGCSSNVGDYSPRVICHNANCVEPADIDEDDTPAALRESLELVDDEDRPLIDGVEIDTFWFGEEERCLFAHDLNNLETASDFDVPVNIITQHLEARALQGKPITRSADRFSVLVELKGHVGTSKSEKHTEEQRLEHVGCAVNIAQRLAASAAVANYKLEVIFTSFDPALLIDLSEDEGFQILRDGDRITARLGVLAGVPKPLDSQTQPIDAFPEEAGIDFASVHPHWTRHASIRAYESRGWSLGLWMFSIVPETLDAIEVYRPDYVTTSEARALTRWLER